MTTSAHLQRPRSAAWLVILFSLAFALAYVPVGASAAALLLAVTGLLLLRWPWLVWPLLAALLPFTSSVKLDVVSVTDFMLAAAVGLWLVDGVRRRSLRITWRPLLLPVTLYIGLLACSSLGARDLGEAVAEVIKWGEFAVVLLLVPQMLAPVEAPWLAAALVSGGMAQALLGLYQFVYGIGPDWFVLFDRFMRASGSFRQPNPFAGYLGLTLPVALSLAIWAWTRLLRQPAKLNTALAWAVFYGAASIVIACGLLASWSRGGWLGAAVGVMVVLVLHSRHAAVFTGVALVGLTTTALLGSLTPRVLPAPVLARLQELPATLGLGDVLSQPVTDENFAVLERVAHWVAAWRMWERAPWLGVGPGNYAAVYQEVRLPQWEEALGHAHNIYLNTLGETGLIGLVFFLVMWATIVAWVWRQFRMSAHRSDCPGKRRSKSLRDGGSAPPPSNSDAAWRAALAVGVLGVLGDLAVHSFFDNLFVQGMTLHIALWLAVLAVAERQEWNSS